MHSVEHYAAIRMNERLPFATTGMDRESIMMSKISPMEKDKSHVSSLMWDIKQSNKQTKTDTDEHSMAAARREGEGQRGKGANTWWGRRLGAVLSTVRHGAGELQKCAPEPYGMSLTNATPIHLT